jgi:hypothetical protein
MLHSSDSREPHWRSIVVSVEICESPVEPSRHLLDVTCQPT